MRITVLGASGKTGRLVIDQALDAGGEVVAYVRRLESLTPRPGLTVIGGDLADVDSLAGALTGSDAVIVTLGPSSIRGVTLMQTVLPLIGEAMTRAGVRRILVQSAFGVGDTASKASLVARFLFATVMRSVYRDHDAGESRLMAGDLDWTVLYPGILTGGARTAGPVLRDLTGVDRVPGLPRVSRADEAAALLICAGDPAMIGRRVLVG